MKPILYLFAVSFLCMTAFGQQSPVSPSNVSLDGTWFLDRSKSSETHFPKGTVWKISSSEHKIHIIKHMDVKDEKIDYELIVFDDNRGEVNYVPIFGTKEKMEVRSHSYWKKGKLIRKYSSYGQPPLIKFDTTEEYSLSQDGNRLFVNSRSVSDYRELPTPTVGSILPHRLVFVRQ
jgi:hypothetical protein